MRDSVLSEWPTDKATEAITNAPAALQAIG
jgi:hypothetical protein